jgi:hypothetical protein
MDDLLRDCNQPFEFGDDGTRPAAGQLYASHFKGLIDMPGKKLYPSSFGGLIVELTL